MIHIPDIKEYVKGQLRTQPIVLFAKTARVSARKGFPGEEIITKMKDGLTETKNIVQKGDMVITNPDGEQYVMPAETFLKKYEIDTDHPEQYRPKGGAQEFIFVKDDISFTAPWGEQMLIKAGGMLNITGREKGDIYGIQRDEFKRTYGACDKTGRLIQKTILKKTHERE